LPNKSDLKSACFINVDLNLQMALNKYLDFLKNIKEVFEAFL